MIRGKRNNLSVELSSPFTEDRICLVLTQPGSPPGRRGVAQVVPKVRSRSQYLVVLLLLLLHLAVLLGAGTAGALTQEHLVPQVGLGVRGPLLARTEHAATQLARPAHHHGVGPGVVVQLVE